MVSDEQINLFYSYSWFSIDLYDSVQGNLKIKSNYDQSAMFAVGADTIRECPELRHSVIILKNIHMSFETSFV